MGDGRSRSRELFSVLQAGGLEPKELIGTFVATEPYDRLLVPMHQIVLGSRGSGKTTLAKMLSHEYMAALSECSDPAQDADPILVLARDLVKEKKFIGMYVATGISWVGPLRNKSWDENSGEAERAFVRRLNLSVCLSFLTTLASCLRVYVARDGRLRTEQEIAADLATLWGFGPSGPQTIRGLRMALQVLESQASVAGPADAAPRGQRSRHPILDGDLLGPLRHAMECADDHLAFPRGCHWILVIDAAEFLTTAQQRLLNTFMRAGLSDLALKLTTLPCFHTEYDTNLGSNLGTIQVMAGHDFEYVYVDPDRITEHPRFRRRQGKGPAENLGFAEELFRKRLRECGLASDHIELGHLLGKSELLDSASDMSTEEALALIGRVGTKETSRRAQVLAKTDIRKFRNEMKRKIAGAARLKEAVAASRKGRRKLSIYSGASMFVRCTDHNPRRMVQLFGELLDSLNYQLPGPDSSKRRPYITRVKQNDILEEYSRGVLNRARAVRSVGYDLHRMLEELGKYLNHQLHGGPISTDQVYSISVSADLPAGLVRVLKAAIGYGYLYPQIREHGDPLPTVGSETAVLHLAYALAPKFHVIPRREKARDLLDMLKSPLTEQLGADAPDQLTLFDVEATDA